MFDRTEKVKEGGMGRTRARCVDEASNELISNRKKMNDMKARVFKRQSNEASVSQNVFHSAVTLGAAVLGEGLSLLSVVFGNDISAI